MKCFTVIRCIWACIGCEGVARQYSLHEMRKSFFLNVIHHLNIISNVNKVYLTSHWCFCLGSSQGSVLTLILFYKLGIHLVENIVWFFLEKKECFSTFRKYKCLRYIHLKKIYMYSIDEHMYCIHSSIWEGISW